MADLAFVVRTPRISADLGGPESTPEVVLSADQLEQLYDVMGEHGYDPRSTHVAAVSYAVIDLPLLRFEIYLADEHGDPAINDDGQPVILEREIALRTALPDWWRPV